MLVLNIAINFSFLVVFRHFQQFHFIASLTVYIIQITFAIYFLSAIVRSMLSTNENQKKKKKNTSISR